MQIPIELPLDADGFLRRECPNCMQEFKWHHGKTDDAPPDFKYPDVYWCPLCGTSATHDSWWTHAQLDYQTEVAARAAHEYLGNALNDTLHHHHNSSVRIEVQQGDHPNEPAPLVEPDDMIMIAPPCHPWEPVKVPDDAEAPFYCLVCGQSYAI